jgi:Type I phosphodiesterase / nucleotide pyrophosphatase
MLKVIALLLLLCLCCALSAHGKRKALIICLDGTKGNVLDEVMWKKHRAPNLVSLCTSGQCTRCESVTDERCTHTHDGNRFGSHPMATLQNYSSYYQWDTAPGWISVFTGTNVDKTHVKSNQVVHMQHYSNDTRQYYPTLLGYAKRGGLRTAASGAANFISAVQVGGAIDYGVLDFECGPWPDAVANRTCNIDYRYPHAALDRQRDVQTTEFGASLIERGLVDVVATHFDTIDEAGHMVAFSALNPLYTDRMHIVDGHVGTLLQAVQASIAARPGEEWIVLATSDHGGSDVPLRGHGDNWLQDEVVPFIVSTMLANNATLDLKPLVEPVRHFDMMPTALEWLGLSHLLQPTLIDGQIQAGIGNLNKKRHAK